MMDILKGGNISVNDYISENEMIVMESIENRNDDDDSE